MDDYQLLKKTAEGDIDSFNAIVQKYQVRLMKYCYRYLRDMQLAEDAVQEVFVKVFKYAPNFEPRASLSAFLYRVATNFCLDTLKQKRRHRKGMPTISFSQVRDASGDVRSMDDLVAGNSAQPDEELLVTEAKKAFMVALEELPEKHKNALVYYEVDQLSYKEICQLMDASLGEVKIWIYRARKKLADILEKAEQAAKKKSGQS